MNTRDPIETLRRHLEQHDAQAAALLREATRHTVAATVLAQVLREMQLPTRSTNHPEA